MITETWGNELNSSILQSQMSGNGQYQVILANRISNAKKRGGGCALLISSQIPIRVLCCSTFGVCEMISVTLFLNVHFNVCCAYRPPNCSPANTKTLIRAIEPFASDHFLLAGDFNLPLIDWEEKTCSDPSGKQLIDFLSQNNLRQYIETPT